MIYPESFGRKQVKDEPDWEQIHERLNSSKRINLQYIWEEEYRPNKDKASVESSVGWLETWLMEWLNGRLQKTEKRNTP